MKTSCCSALLVTVRARFVDAFLQTLTGRRCDRVSAVIPDCVVLQKVLVSMFQMYLIYEMRVLEASSGPGWLHGALALFQLLQMCELPLYGIIQTDITRATQLQTVDISSSLIASSNKWHWRALDVIDGVVQLSAAVGCGYFLMNNAITALQ